MPDGIDNAAPDCSAYSVAVLSEIVGAIGAFLERYGDNALEESAARANELALASDDDGAATRRRIMAAVEQLVNKTPPGRIN